MSERFADIILPLPLANSYTYKIPEELSDSVKLGMRVVVPFGSKKIYTGIVRYVHEGIHSSTFQTQTESFVTFLRTIDVRMWIVQITTQPNIKVSQ